jgi:PiT family inorganic phosphate transporter
MSVALIAGIVLLAFANGANDNFKGVATLWGTGMSSNLVAALLVGIASRTGVPFPLPT